MQDLFDENILRQKVEGALKQKNHLLVKVYNRRAIAVDEVVDELLRTPSGCAHGRRHLAAAREALDRDETVLFEGGQATMLDVDHGTYPFVTSSNATAGGACTGSGIAPTHRPRHRHRQGLHDARRRGPVPHRAVRRDGELLRSIGHEFGTTTGRPRRCGWYDAPIARYASRINGVTDFV